MAVFLFTIFLSLRLVIMSNVVIYNWCLLLRGRDCTGSGTIGTRPVIRGSWLFDILPLTAIHGSWNTKHERGKNENI
jgi:hypothetical protein